MMTLRMREGPHPDNPWERVKNRRRSPSAPHLWGTILTRSLIRHLPQPPERFTLQGMIAPLHRSATILTPLPYPPCILSLTHDTQIFTPTPKTSLSTLMGSCSSGYPHYPCFPHPSLRRLGRQRQGIYVPSCQRQPNSSLPLSPATSPIRHLPVPLLGIVMSLGEVAKGECTGFGGTTLSTPHLRPSGKSSGAGGGYHLRRT